ncbi:hypothetical protein [Streptomyces purpureus]|uniref:hypothetical protein n=1 Tax=Streptomyces purpureus TaxID=1951 RepID=UPI000378A2CC|nr:hypothetical protein [Streptomyces purpureus]
MIIRTGRRAMAAVGAALLASAVLTGCGGEDAATAVVPQGWGELRTAGVDVACPKGFKEQGAGERSRYNAAAATLTQGGRTVGLITVQLDFTNADSAEEAAIGAEAGVQLGSTIEGTKDVEIAGTDDAKRVDFAFTSSGEENTPVAGTRVHGTIVTGLDSKDVTFAVRIDAQKGVLDDADLRRIIESIEVH